MNVSYDSDITCGEYTDSYYISWIKRAPYEQIIRYIIHC